MEKKRLTSVAITQEMKKEMKMFCAEHNMNMKQLAETAVKIFMSQKENKK